MDEKTKDYSERRRMVWCAAYGAAFAARWVPWMTMPDGVEARASVVKLCVKIAQEAAASFPAPGEESAL